MWLDDIIESSNLSDASVASSASAAHAVPHAVPPRPPRPTPEQPIVKPHNAPPAFDLTIPNPRSPAFQIASDKTSRAFLVADRAYQNHHIKCLVCIAAGRGERYATRCPEGLRLWRAYVDTGDEAVKLMIAGQLVSRVLSAIDAANLPPQPKRITPRKRAESESVTGNVLWAFIENSNHHAKKNGVFHPKPWTVYPQIEGGAKPPSIKKFATETEANQYVNGLLNKHLKITGRYHSERYNTNIEFFELAGIDQVGEQ